MPSTCRDLREEFWPFFPDTVRAIAAALEHPPAEGGPEREAEVRRAA